MVIDLSKKQMLNESFVKMLGTWSKTLLKYMYGDDVQVVANVNEDEETTNAPKFIIRGKQKDVKAYASAIIREKEYLDAIVEYGKEHLQSAKARERLDMAVREFELTTGLIWPFKDEE